MKLYSQKDVDKKALKGARIAILGYGSQGRAHALNLKDSGFDVVVGVRKGGASWKKAQARRPRGRRARRGGRAARTWWRCWCPTSRRRRLYQAIRKSLKNGATLLFAHGFNIHFKQIKPRKDLDVVLIAPKGPGDLVRRQYQQGRGVPCLLAVAQDATGKAHAQARSPMPTASAARAAACSRPPSPRRPRPTCSASRRCCAAGRPSWW